MGVPTAFCLLGILTCSFFLGVDADGCPKGWLQVQGNCYLYVEKPATWHQAETQCQSNGRKTHLVSILTEQETKLVAQFIIDKQMAKNNVWTGFNDLNKKGQWKWSDESEYNYQAWVAGQPDNKGNSEFCAELTGYTAYKGWNDVSCESRRSYVCKHEESVSRGICSPQQCLLERERICH